ncbi:hypothetical protein BW737_002785 [Actinomyces ruminis]|uniref:Uncharacterized protein n=1 Tax=Actinomyces ruminis TaxID=1937003 RepID=A0ABX4MD50_9ACTO|nr:hypothetical protein BW737_002785 [Actinomyces ruminis]
MCIPCSRHSPIFKVTGRFVDAEATGGSADWCRAHRWLAQQQEKDQRRQPVDNYEADRELSTGWVFGIVGSACPVDAHSMGYANRRDQILRVLAAAGGAARARYLATDRTQRRAIARMVEEGVVQEHPGRVIALPGTRREVIVARQVGGSSAALMPWLRAGSPHRMIPAPTCTCLCPPPQKSPLYALPAITSPACMWTHSARPMPMRRPC